MLENSRFVLCDYNHNISKIYFYCKMVQRSLYLMIKLIYTYACMFDFLMLGLNYLSICDAFTNVINNYNNNFMITLISNSFSSVSVLAVLVYER